MFSNIVTLTDFIIKEEHTHHNTTGHLSLLLTHLENCAKIIASHLRRNGLSDFLGNNGNTNIYGDEVQKLDEFANELLVNTFKESKLVTLIGSEELEEPIHISDTHAKYSIFFDPIDGSSNIDTNASTGTIFSIYKNSNQQYPLGSEQIIAGYILYGASTIFVYTSGQEVNGFTLDPSIGSFILSNPKITIPEKGYTYYMNEAYFNLLDDNHKNYLNFLKAKVKEYKQRSTGCFIADIHQIFQKGGIFMYPADTSSPHGKLRLLYEINPIAFLIQKAGGRSISSRQDPLLVQPNGPNHQLPFVCGSKENMKEYLKFMISV
ncbi:MAG TPA: class 1 fructose-bisphosphatase [Candidatus Nitrosocosmicus sp.]|nr:class 1 fructose-bisphosphatase [Candidatus Nitrosocosmicus sp.]